MLRKIGVLLLGWLTILAQSGAIAAKDDPKDDHPITSPCNIKMSAIGSKDPYLFNKMTEFRKAPAPAAETANAKLSNTVETIVVAPVTPEQYGVLFPAAKGKLTKSQETEVAAIQTSLKDSLKKEHGDDEFNREDFEKVLKDAKASFVIVVGHIAEGGAMPLLDGHLVSAADIVAKAREDQRVILVGCQSAAYVSNKEVTGTIKDEVTYEEAFKIAASISDFIKSSKGPLSILDVQSELDKTVNKEKRYKVALFIIEALCKVGAVIAVALIIRKLDPCSDENKSSDCGKKPTKSSDLRAPRGECSIEGVAEGCSPLFSAFALLVPSPAYRRA